MTKIKSFLSILILISACYVSCTKENQELLDLMRKVVAQNDSLNFKVQILQRTTDSISNILKSNNQNVLAVNVKIDSIKSQLSQLSNQINSININFTNLNTNFQSIQIELNLLNAKYLDLFNQMQQLLMGMGNSGKFPEVSTLAVRDTLSNAPVAEGSISTLQSIPIIAKGFVWDTIQFPTLPSALNSRNGSGTGNFSQILTGLVSGKKYYLRSYASNINGTSYGNEITFIARAVDPVENSMLPYVVFNGIDSYMQIGLTQLFTGKIFGKSFSVECWIKSDRSSNVDQMILGTGYLWNGGIGAFALTMINGRISARVGNFSGYSTSAIFPIDKMWHHVVFQHDNLNQISQIFIDGKIKSRITHLGTSHMVPATQGLEGMGANLDLGNINPREYFSGSIRKARVTEGIAYQAEFTPLTQYLPINTTIAYWEMNEGSGNIIQASNSTYNGTLYNCSWHK